MIASTTLPHTPDAVSDRSLFDELAPHYWAMDFVSFGLSNQWRQRAVDELRLHKEARVCDLMTGGGNSWPAIWSHLGTGGSITALDYSEPMLMQAREHLNPHHRETVQLVYANVLDDVLPDAAFDAVLCTFGAKHIEERHYHRFAQIIHRLLKPGGRYSFLEMTLPTDRLLRFGMLTYMGQVMPLLAKLLTGHENSFRHLAGYTRQFGNFQRLETAFQQVGLETSVTSIWGGCASILNGRKLSKPL